MTRLCNGGTPYFYPRPPRGGRLGRIGGKTETGKFLSTPSARRATHNNFAKRVPVLISIHALREEGDDFTTIPRLFYRNFYPRPPRGGRHLARIHAECCIQFLSTPSARRATCRFGIQPHPCTYFYPRPPRGGRPGRAEQNSPLTRISIHALREEGDDVVHSQIHDLRISIHALREEGDSLAINIVLLTSDFYPRPPRGGRPM